MDEKYEKLKVLSRTRREVGRLGTPRPERHVILKRVRRCKRIVEKVKWAMVRAG
jgi:hypothetical protein